MFRDVTSEANMDRILRRPAVEARTGLSRSTLYDHMRNGTFPRPVPLGTKSVGWLESDISKWIDDRVAEREVA
jgi:prophage regulatory protein